MINTLLMHHEFEGEMLDNNLLEFDQKNNNNVLELRC